MGVIVIGLILQAGRVKSNFYRLIGFHTTPRSSLGWLLNTTKTRDNTQAATIYSQRMFY